MTRSEKCKLFESKGFKYDPETGVIKTNKGKTPKPNLKGYIYLGIRLKGKIINLLAHQFAWWIYYHEIHEDDLLVIDHKDRDRSNNRITNLHLIAKENNTINSEKWENCKGYCFNKRIGKWWARIPLHSKRKSLGYYDTGEEARTAYLTALALYYPDRYNSLREKGLI